MEPFHNLSSLGQTCVARKSLKLLPFDTKFPDMIASRPDSVSASCPTLVTSVTACTAMYEEHVHDPRGLCRYPSKKCLNPRVLKRNGERHNLCEFHRLKANKNQRRLELKRKARAQAFAGEEIPNKSLRVHKKQRQRTRRAPLSTHLAMKEEARAKAEERSKAKAFVSGLTNNFLHDLVLLDGMYDRIDFNRKKEQPDVSIKSIRLNSAAKSAQEEELLYLPDAMDNQMLDRILEDEQAKAAAVGRGEHTGRREDAMVLLPEVEMSPLDVSESWDTLNFSDHWLTVSPADLSAKDSDAQVAVKDENVLVADV